MKRDRRPLIAVIGDASVGEQDPHWGLAEETGRLLVERGARVVTGGLRGVMTAAHRGAHGAACYREGDTVALLPGHDPSLANPWADVVIATGLSIGRNLIVANADGVVAIGGGAGTLSELALAWQLRRPIVAFADASGWAARLAGLAIDDRRRPVDVADDCVHAVRTPREAVERLLALLPAHSRRLGAV
jgi:uncharacterized protein (TIGR00725 family)